MSDYQFNIALNGVHLFRTDWYDFNDAMKIVEQLVKRFPDKEGFTVTRTIRETTMRSADIQE